MVETTGEKNFCYLCGEIIENTSEGDKDHIPPKSFIPKSIRESYYKTHNHQYMKIHSHSSCNNGWNDIAKTTLLKFGLMATDPELNQNSVVRGKMEEHLQKVFPHGGATKGKAEKCLNDFYKVSVARGFKEYPIFRFTQEDTLVFLNIGKAIYTFEVGKYLDGKLSLEYQSILHRNSNCLGFIKVERWEEGINGNQQIMGNKEWFCYQIIHRGSNGFISFVLWNTFFFQVVFKKHDSDI